MSVVSLFPTPPSDPAPLLRAAAVVGNGGDVLDAGYFDAGGGQRADGRLPARAGSAHEDVDLAHAVLHGPARRLLGRHLCSEWRGLARPLEADVAGRRPRQHVP